MKTFYIVKEYLPWNKRPEWIAYRRGVLSTFNIFNPLNQIHGSSSYTSAGECEEFLRNILHPIKPRIIKIIKI